MTKPRQNSSIWSCVRRRRNGKCRRANGARRKPSSPSCSKTGSSWHDGQPAPHTRFLIVPGYCGAQDTFYVGTMKGVGRIYQQTFIDTYAKIAFAKLYDRKTPITAADLLNDRVVPFYDSHEVKLCRVLTDRGTEYCGTHDRHE